LTTLLLVAFGTAALVPPAQYQFLLGLGGALTGATIAVLAIAAPG